MGRSRPASSRPSQAEEGRLSHSLPSSLSLSLSLPLSLSLARSLSNSLSLSLPPSLSPSRPSSAEEAGRRRPETRRGRRFRHRGRKEGAKGRKGSGGGGAGAARLLGEVEVGEHDVARVVQQDVLRLQVAAGAPGGYGCIRAGKMLGDKSSPARAGRLASGRRRVSPIRGDAPNSRDASFCTGAQRGAWGPAPPLGIRTGK